MVMVCAKVHTRPMYSSTPLENPKSLFGDFAIRANDGNVKLFALSCFEPTMPLMQVQKSSGPFLSWRSAVHVIMRLDSGSFLRQTPLSCCRPSTEVPTAGLLDRQGCANATALAVLHSVMHGARG